jgi:predicted enzyme related to lactoylglutathione lyase
MFKDAKAFSSFSVSDIDAAFSFYKNVLGLDAKKTPEGLAISFTSGAEVFIYPKSDHMPATYTVLNFSVPDVEKVVVDLAAEGVNMEQYDMGELKTDERGIAINESGVGPRAMAWFKDPSGNILGIMQES